MFCAKTCISILLAVAVGNASALTIRQSSPSCLDNLGEGTLGNVCISILVYVAPQIFITDASNRETTQRLATNSS